MFSNISNAVSYQLFYFVFFSVTTLHISCWRPLILMSACVLLQVYNYMILHVNAFSKAHVYTCYTSCIITFFDDSVCAKHCRKIESCIYVVLFSVICFEYSGYLQPCVHLYWKIQFIFTGYWPNSSNLWFTLRNTSIYEKVTGRAVKRGRCKYCVDH